MNGMRVYVENEPKPTQGWRKSSDDLNKSSSAGFLGLFYMLILAHVGGSNFLGHTRSAFVYNPPFWLFASIVWPRTMLKCAGVLPVFCELPPGKTAFREIFSTHSTGCLCDWCLCTQGKVVVWITAYVAVPCRDQRLFRRVFQFHYCVWSTVLLNFC